MYLYGWQSNTCIFLILKFLYEINIGWVNLIEKPNGSTFINKFEGFIYLFVYL